ncbi:MAG: nucleotidyltransferase domain-containing protein, partial [Chromatiales bacterium]|nr:nucleotidyltransferase domain-containing protein [Chromatiales bacterium]
MADQHGLAATQLTDLQLFFTSSFDRALAGTATPIQLFRHALRTVDDALEDRFHHGTPAAQLVHQRAWYIDELLIRAWDRIMPVSTIDIALAAVGGYGRGELHPHSDIDLLILCTPETKREDGGIESLLAFLWDIGIKVSHSVRTIEECVQEAHQDVSIATNLMEARLLAGAQTLFNAMQARTTPPQLWPAEAFYRAKLSERAARHRKYHDTAYNLEPNVKEGPGGLRDLQTIAWIAQRHFGTSNLDELAARGFLCAQERSELLTCRDFLWKVRYGLHLQSGRDENRLLFDHQQALARELGYEDS